jgi:hypothetical protein
MLGSSNERHCFSGHTGMLQTDISGSWCLASNVYTNLVRFSIEMAFSTEIRVIIREKVLSSMTIDRMTGSMLGGTNVICT